MNISGIVVQSASGRLEAVIDSLTSIDGVDVHQVDTQSSRLVATIEAANTGSEVATLRAIKSNQNCPMWSMPNSSITVLTKSRRSSTRIPPTSTPRPVSIRVPYPQP